MADNEDVISMSPEELEARGYTTRLSSPGEFLNDYLRTNIPSPPPAPSPEQIRTDRERAYNAFNPFLGGLGAGITRGALGAAEGAAGFGEVLGRMVPGGKFVQPFFKKAGDYLSETSANVPSKVPSFTQIKDIGDLGQYSSEQIGSLLGYMAPAAAFAILTGGGSVEAQAGEKGLTIAQQLYKKLLPRLAAGSFVPETGLAFREIRDVTGREAPGISLVAGGINAALEALPEAGLMKRILEGSPAVRRAGLRAYMQNVLKETAKYGLIEGVTEGAQETVNVLADKFADSTYDAINENNLIRVTDAFLAGLMGGGLGAGGVKAIVPGGLNIQPGDTVRDIPKRIAESWRTVFNPPPPAAPPLPSPAQVATAAASRDVSDAAGKALRDSVMVAAVGEQMAGQIVSNPSIPAKPPSIPVTFAEQAPAEPVGVRNASRVSQEPKPLPSEGRQPEGVQAEGGNRVEPVPPEQPQPVEPGAEVQAAPQAPEKVAPAPAIPPATPEKVYKKSDANKMNRMVARWTKLAANADEAGLSDISRDAALELTRLTGLVPDEQINSEYTRLEQAINDRRAELRPEFGDLLIDSRGNPVDATAVYDRKTKTIKIKAGDRTIYTSESTFPSHKSFIQNRDAALSDPSMWKRSAKADAWFTHDAPYAASQASGSTGQWVDSMVAALKNKIPNLGGAVQELISSGGLTVDALNGLMARAYGESGTALKTGKAIRPTRMTPIQFAEKLPGAIRSALESELREADEKSEINFIEAAGNWDHDALTQWLSGLEGAPTQAPVVGPKTAERREERSAPVVESHPDRAMRLADSIAGMLNSEEAGRIVYDAITQGSTDREQFISQITPIIQKSRGVTPDVAAANAASVYDLIDESRAGGTFYGSLSEGQDYRPQNSAEDPLTLFSANGGAQIVDLLKNPLVGFDPRLVRFTELFMDELGLAGRPEYLAGLNLQVVNRIDNKGNQSIVFDGTYEPLLRLAKVALNSSNPDVLAHEMAHDLFYFLPDQVKKEVDEEWKRSLVAAIKRERDPIIAGWLRNILANGGIKAGLRGAVRVTPVAPNEARVVASRVLSMTPEEFYSWAEEQEGGFTSTAYAVGDATVSSEDLAALKRSMERIQADQERIISKEKLSDSELEEAQVLGSKGQFFSEAYGRATGTGSAGEQAFVDNPNFQPNFPQGEATETARRNAEERRARGAFGSLAGESPAPTGLELSGPAVARTRLGPLNSRVSGTQISNRLRNLATTGALPPGELRAAESVGLAQYLGSARTPAELAQWWEENVQKPEVKVFGSGENATGQQRQIAELRHWRETLPEGMRNDLDEIYDPTFGDRDPSELIQRGWSEESAKKADDYHRIVTMQALEERGFDPDVYRSIAPKDKDQTVVMVRVPLSPKEAKYQAKVEPRGEGYTNIPNSSEVLHRGSHFGSEDVNVLGWTRIQYETLPDGRKVAHIIEQQDDLIDKAPNGRFYFTGDYRNLPGDKTDFVNAAKPPYTSNGQPTFATFNEANAALAKAWPITADRKRLSLKSAIDQAGKDGADVIMVSDAETAMMTEGHDLQPYIEVTPQNKGLAESIRHEPKIWGRLDSYNRERINGLLRNEPQAFTEIDPYLGDLGFKFSIPQEKGMRLNYDTILPRIMQELTGDKGGWVSLGEHQRAFEAVGREGEPVGPMESPRQNLIFREPTGEPKTTVTGRMFRRPDRTTPFSVYGKDVFRPGLQPGISGRQAVLSKYYHLTHPEEYFVHRLIQRTNPGTVWDYVKGFIRHLANVFKRWIGLDANLWDRIADGFRNGEFEPRYQAWTTESRMIEPGAFGSLSETRQQFADNVAAQATPKGMEREALSAMAQNLDGRRIMERISDRIENSGGFVGQMARRLAGITQSNEVTLAAQEYTDPKTFLESMANPAIDDGTKEVMARDVSAFWRRKELALERIGERVKTMEEAFKGPVWQKRLEKLSDIKARLEQYRQDQTKRLISLIDAAIAYNQKELQERSVAEGRSEQILREISALERLKSEKAGIGQLMNHMLSVLSLDPEGRQLIMGQGEFTADEVLRAYENIVGPTNLAREITGLNVDEDTALYANKERVRKITRDANALLNAKRAFYSDAAGFITRMHDLSRDLMMTELLATDADAYTDYVQQYGTRWLKELQNNPAEFARRRMRQVVNAGTKEGLMIAAFNTLNRKLTRSLNLYNANLTAQTILSEALKDPTIRTAYQLALNRIESETPPVGADGEVRGSDIPMDELGNLTTALPDGKTVKVNIHVKREFLPQEQRKLEQAISTIHDYLISDDGKTDPYRRFWELREKLLAGIYHSDVVLGFNPPAELAKGGWGILDRLLRSIGTPAANTAVVHVGNLNAASDKIGNWMRRDSWKTLLLLEEAARSHPEIWGSGKSKSERILDWYDVVANPYFGKANHMGIVMRVGEELQPGSSITEADEKALHGISSVIDQLYAVAPAIERDPLMSRVTLEDRFGQKPEEVLFRKPIKAIPYMMPRVFRRRAIEFSRFIHGITEGKPVAEWPAETREKVITAIDANFHDFVRAFLEDRGKFAQGEFDPKTYRAALDRLVSGSANGLGDLIDPFRADPISADWSTDEAMTQLLGEINRQIETVYGQTADAESDPRAQMIWLSQQNSFTSSRREPIANHWFYDYGLRNNAAILNLGADALDFYYQRLRSSLSVLNSQLLREITTIRQKYPPPHKMSAEDYARFSELQTQHSSLQKLTNQLDEAHGTTGRKAAMDWHFGRRSLGTLVGAAISNPVTATINLIGSYIRVGLMYQAMFGARTLNPSWAWQYGKEIVKAVPLAARGALKAPGAALKTYAKERRIGPALLSAMDEVVNQTWLKDLSIGQWNAAQRYQEMADYGWFPYISPERFQALWRLAETGGAIYTPKYSTIKPVAKLQAIANQGITYLGLILSELPSTVFPRLGDMVANAGAMNLAEHVSSNIKLEAARTFERLGADGIAQQFNLSNPGDVANVVLPQMVLGGWASNNNLTYAQELYRAAGIGLNEEVVGYWKRLNEAAEGRRGEVEFIDSNRLQELAKVLAEEINKATRTNRPTALYNNGILRVFLPLMGWNWGAARQAVRWFGRAKFAAKGETIQQLRVLQAIAVAGLLGSATIGALGQEELLRRIYRWLLGEERPGRQPWEADTPWEAMKRTILAASTIAPVLNIVPNIMFNDTPAAASVGMDLFVQNKVKDMLGYISGVVNTGDPAYGLPDWAKRTFPILRPFVNKLPGYEGVIDLRNQTRLIQRYAPEDLRRPATISGSFASTATELTPYGRKMVNAAMRGDFDELTAIYQEAVQKAVELGRADPDKVVKQLYAAQSPVRVALKAQPSPEQWAAILEKMDPDERARFLEAIGRYQAGGQVLGVDVEMYKQARGGGSPILSQISQTAAGPSRIATPTSGRAAAYGFPSARRGASRYRVRLSRPRAIRARGSRVLRSGLRRSSLRLRNSRMRLRL